MSVENDCNIRLTYMLPCACYCLLDACNMHVTCTLFRIGLENIVDVWNRKNRIVVCDAVINYDS